MAKTQADAKSLWDSWNITAEEAKRNQYAGNDYAEDIYLLNMAYNDHSSEEYNDRLAGLLLERMRKLEANGQDPYDSLNRDIYHQLYTAGYRLNNNDEFSVDGFNTPMLTGQYFGAGQALSPYTAQNLPTMREGERVAEDKYGNGIYVPKGEYTDEEYQAAIDRAIDEHNTYVMRPDAPNAVKYNPKNKNVQKDPTLAYPNYEGTIGGEYSESYVNSGGLQPWRTSSTPSYDNSYLSALNSYAGGGSSSSGSGKTASVGNTGAGNYASGTAQDNYDSTDNTRQAYLNALDAYVRGTQATGGNANSNAVRNGQYNLVANQAPKKAYSDYVTGIDDTKNRYKNITKKRSLY